MSIGVEGPMPLPSNQTEKGKPGVSQGRKARGLSLRDSSAASAHHGRCVHMLQGLFSRHTRLVGAVISVLGIAVLSGAPAKAALITTDACDNATLSQPFAQFNDSNEYKLVPGGSFENGASGWTLGHGASIVSGSEPYGATGSVGASSVQLTAGSSVTPPSTCVDAAYPTFRFFARNNGLLSTVLVSVVYKPLLGLPIAVP